MPGDTISEANERKKALIIAVSNYDTESLGSLDFCRNDGEKMYDLLTSGTLGYEVSENNILIGKVKGETMRRAIMEFFTKNVKSKDTLLFYFSGHGIPDSRGDIFLATSDIDPNFPYFEGFSVGQLSEMMDMSISTRLVTILDCCYSGAAGIGIGKGGSEQDTAKLGAAAIEKKSRILEQGEGRCLLAASFGAEQAYGLKQEGHSIFTYYLLEGLKGAKGESVDVNGRVTPDSLGSYVYEKVTDMVPNQRPMKRMQSTGNIILAYYPELRPMSNEIRLASLLKLIRDGNVEEFNKRRQQYVNLPLDFAREDLHGIRISGINLSSANLSRANLIKANLEGANLSNSNLFKSDLEGANLYRANIAKADLEGANLSNSNLTKADISNANLTGSNLSYANLYGANFQNTTCIGADLTGANRTDLNLSGADLTGAIFDQKLNEPKSISKDPKQIGMSTNTKDIMHSTAEHDTKVAGTKPAKSPIGISSVREYSSNRSTAGRLTERGNTKPFTKQGAPHIGVEEATDVKKRKGLRGNSKLLISVIGGVGGILAIIFILGVLHSNNPGSGSTTITTNTTGSSPTTDIEPKINGSITSTGSGSTTTITTNTTGSSPTTDIEPKINGR